MNSSERAGKEHVLKTVRSLGELCSESELKGRSENQMAKQRNYRRTRSGRFKKGKKNHVEISDIAKTEARVHKLTRIKVRLGRIDPEHPDLETMAVLIAQYRARKFLTHADHRVITTLVDRHYRVLSDHYKPDELEIVSEAKKRGL